MFWYFLLVKYSDLTDFNFFLGILVENYSCIFKSLIPLTLRSTILDINLRRISDFYADRNLSRQGETYR